MLRGIASAMNTEGKKHRKEAVSVSYLSGYPSIAR